MIVLHPKHSMMNFRVILSIILCALLLSLSQNANAATKWKSLTADESEVKLKNFSDECRISTANAADYSRKYIVFFCPRYANATGPETYIRVQKLLGNYYWGSNSKKDFSEHAMFTAWKGGRNGYFKDPIIAPGQKTKCLSDSDCYFQRITFSVKGRDCQYINYSPNLRNISRSASSERYALEVFTCHTATPITEDKITIKRDSVVITFPDTSQPSKETDRQAGNSPDNQNASSSSSNSSDSNGSHLKEMPDKTLCFGATKADGNWEQEYAYKKFVNEAKSRSLSLERCSELTGRPNPFPKATQNPPAKSVSKESDSVEIRLEKLKKLEDAGLITSEEAAEKRKEILKSM